MKEFLIKLKSKPYYKLIIILICLAIIIPVGYTASRYIMNVINDHFLESKNFYFNSNRLKSDNPTYLINNWSGVGEFSIDISLNSNKNHILASDFDVEYGISYVCPNDVICTSNKSSGVIYKATHTDEVVISIMPTRAFDDGESITIQVEATSTSPYVETISAEFKIVVGKRGVSYAIDDQVNRPYMLVSITNALASYTIKQAFGLYSIGEQIDSRTYKSLSDIDKQKCVSIMIELAFNPNTIVMDTTSLISGLNILEEVVINGVSYVSRISFPMEALTSNEIRFYKLDYTSNYTYPYENATSIVNFNAY